MIIRSEAELAAPARKILAAPARVVALYGELGSGKTVLTKAIARELSVAEEITSPTFTIVCEYYSGSLPLFHFDLYRIASENELAEALDINEYFSREGLVVIEWPETIESALPPETTRVKLEYAPEENSDNARKITML
jgi:tRNA threonylcarbamoyladenosine biosynthesis protein TsaE